MRWTLWMKAKNLFNNKQCNYLTTYMFSFSTTVAANLKFHIHIRTYISKVMMGYMMRYDLKYSTTKTVKTFTWIWYTSECLFTGTFIRNKHGSYAMCSIVIHTYGGHLWGFSKKFFNEMPKVDNVKATCFSEFD